MCVNNLPEVVWWKRSQHATRRDYR